MPTIHAHSHAGKQHQYLIKSMCTSMQYLSIQFRFCLSIHMQVKTSYGIRVVFVTMLANNEYCYISVVYDGKSTRIKHLLMVFLPSYGKGDELLQ